MLKTIKKYIKKIDITIIVIIFLSVLTLSIFTLGVLAFKGADSLTDEQVRTMFPELFHKDNENLTVKESPQIIIKNNGNNND